MFSEEPFFLAEIDGSWIAFTNSPMTATGSPMTANGGTDPYPIPWLDKNGSHNQPAGPKLEPSHIYHFKGRVARSSTFAMFSRPCVILMLSTAVSMAGNVQRIFSDGTPTSNGV